eukprot:6213588-Pleurochrysis_carterae.AAC.3
MDLRDEINDAAIHEWWKGLKNKALLVVTCVRASCTGFVGKASLHRQSAAESKFDPAINATL